MTLDVVIVGQQLRRAAPGGIGTYVRGLLQGLEELGSSPNNGVRPTLWWSRSGGIDSQPLGAGVVSRTAPWPGPLLTRLWDVGLAPFPSGFSVGHATSLSVPPVRRRGPPVTAFVHDTLWRTLPEAYPARGRRWHDAALRRVVQRAHTILVPSSATADGLLAIGVASNRIVVTGEGCDHLPLADRFEGGYLLAVSTLEPRKNLARLVEAYARARPSFPKPWPLKIVGPAGWGASGLPSVLSAGVELVGAVCADELARLYAGARALVYVPLREGWGLPPVEAMRAGTPVVASNMASTGGAVLEVDPLDVDAISAAIVRVSTDEHVRQDLVESGSARASSLRWADTARQHVETWREVSRGH